MAKYKTLLDGEIQMFSDIENELVDLAAVKGIAFENSSIEESEREIFEQIDEEKAMRGDDLYDGRRSQNSELLKSIQSNHDYWQNLTDKAQRKRTKLA